MTSGRAARDGAGPRSGAGTVRPDHLVVWLHGRVAAGDDQVVDDARLDDEFLLERWVPEIRAAYEDSVVAATYPSAVEQPASVSADVDWLDLTRTAAGVDLSGDERSFIGDTTPTSLAALRRWAAQRVDGRGFSPHDVALALSELSTNVENHGGGWLTVDLVDRGDVLVLAVTDPVTDRIPEPRRPAPDEESGRGLFVVSSVAFRWGLVVRPAFKTVWAAFAPAGDSAHVR